jgi:hypothetical protein
VYSSLSTLRNRSVWIAIRNNRHFVLCSSYRHYRNSSRPSEEYTQTQSLAHTQCVQSVNFLRKLAYFQTAHAAIEYFSSRIFNSSNNNKNNNHNNIKSIASWSVLCVAVLEWVCAALKISQFS